MITRYIVLLGISIGLPVAAESEFVDFSREDAARMPIESALEIAESCLGVKQLISRESPQCTNFMAAIEPGGPDLVTKSMQVEFSWFQGVTKNDNTLLQVPAFKTGDMECSMSLSRPVDDGGIGLASALYRMSLETDSSVFDEYYSAQTQSAEAAPTGDQILEC